MVHTHFKRSVIVLLTDHLNHINNFRTSPRADLEGACALPLVFVEIGCLLTSEHLRQKEYTKSCELTLKITNFSPLLRHSLSP